MAHLARRLGTLTTDSSSDETRDTFDCFGFCQRLIGSDFIGGSDVQIRSRRARVGCGRRATGRRRSPLRALVDRVGAPVGDVLVDALAVPSERARIGGGEFAVRTPT